MKGPAIRTALLIPVLKSLLLCFEIGDQRTMERISSPNSSSMALKEENNVNYLPRPAALSSLHQLHLC